MTRFRLPAGRLAVRGVSTRHCAGVFRVVSRAVVCALGSAVAPLIALVVPAAVSAQATAAAVAPRGAAELAQRVDALGTTARVLVVGAHPDDEDTRLIAYLARGRHVETAYLALTRGDGGQNLIGNELGESLGAIRTEELLAARRIDGGRQYFTRAFDFGFSKTADETFRHWPHDAVLGDVVRVVRAFRPHVMIAIFSGTPADGHGHHQASGILAREAYDAAGDTVRFPASQFGPAWPVGKFYRNTSYRGAETATLRYDAGTYDPVIGRSDAELAAISRSQHKSQGQGGLEPHGESIVSMRREATRVNADVPANREHDLFDAIDTSVTRVRSGAGCAAARAAIDSLRPATDRVRATTDLRHPDRVLVALADAQRLAARAGAPVPGLHAVGTCAPATPDAVTTLARLQDGIAATAAVAAGILIEVVADREIVAGGDSVRVTQTVYNRGSDTVTVESRATDRRPDGTLAEGPVRVLPAHAVRSVGWYHAAPTAAAVTMPWWLARPRRGDLFDYGPTIGSDPAAWAAVPEGDQARVTGRQPSQRVAVVVRGIAIVRDVPIVVRSADPVRGDVERPLAVAPAVSVTLDRAVQYAPSGTAFDRAIVVHLRSASAAARTATVRLELPVGLSADSATRVVMLAGYDARASASFRVRATLRPGRVTIRAVVESGGGQFANGYQLIDYEHIRPQRIYRAAETAIEAVDVALPARAQVAYVPGVGDNVAPMLADLGLAVTTLDSAGLAGDLSRFTHIVVGPRAYERNAGLIAHNARLLDWVRGGGTMVVQYGQYEMTGPGVMPYPITLARPAQRVTIEEAPVRVLAPSAGVLTAPNRIGPNDWAGWTQERSTYMPETAAARYQSVIAMNDPGEAPNANGILIAAVGRGTYVYSTLALFRQLPAGVPGAARLVANMLAAHAASDPTSHDGARPTLGP